MTVDMVINLALVFFVGNVLGDLRRRQPRLHPRPRVRAQRLRAPAAGSAGLAEADQAQQDLGADRGVLCAAFNLFITVMGVWYHGADRLRRHEGGAVRRRRPRHLDPPLPVPAGSCRTGRRRSGVRTTPDDAGSRGGELRPTIEFERGGCGRPSRVVVRIRRVEGSRPPSSRSLSASAISAPEAFGASFDVAPRPRRSSSARGSRAIRQSRSAGRSACSRPG